MHGRVCSKEGEREAGSNKNSRGIVRTPNPLGQSEEKANPFTGGL